MLKNVYVRIAVIIVLVIILFYLVITLARSVATADDSPMLQGTASGSPGVRSGEALSFDHDGAVHDRSGRLHDSHSPK